MTGAWLSSRAASRSRIWPAADTGMACSAAAAQQVKLRRRVESTRRRVLLSLEAVIAPISRHRPNRRGWLEQIGGRELLAHPPAELAQGQVSSRNQLDQEIASRPQPRRRLGRASLAGSSRPAKRSPWPLLPSIGSAIQPRPPIPARTSPEVVGGFDLVPVKQGHRFGRIFADVDGYDDLERVGGVDPMEGLN